MQGSAMKVSLTIDGKPCQVDENTSILEAARQAGIAIPTLCHHPALSGWGGCRLCLVEVDGAPRLVASCVTPVRNGMNVVTRNDRILESRRTLVEFLFAERNHNCMICPRSGDCELQQLAYALGMDHLSVPFSFQAFPTDLTSGALGMDHNRCVLCGRCVRACSEIAGADALGFHHRGPDTMVGLDCMDSRETSSCLECGVCLQVCPTGAIYNRYRTHAAVKGHRAETRVSNSVCPLCGLLCPTRLRFQNGRLTAVEGRPAFSDHRPDRGQLCRRGRFDLFKDPGLRLTRALQRMADGGWLAVGWDQAIEAAIAGLGGIRRRHGAQAIFGWTSSMASNEELLLFREMMARTWSAGRIDALDGDDLRTMAAVLNGAGSSCREFPWQRIPEADMVLLAGADVQASQPMLISLLRQLQKEKGTVLAVVGAQTFPTPLVSLHLAPSRDRLVRVVEALAATVKGSLQEAAVRNRDGGLPSDNPDLQKPLCEAGLDARQTAMGLSIAQAYAAARRPLIIAGAGCGGSQGRPALEALGAMAQLKQTEADLLDLLFLKSAGNSSGAWRMGAAADRGDPGMPFKGGVIRLSGEAAEAETVMARLDALDYLVVLTPCANEKVQARAHLLIPIPIWLEADGSYLSLDGSQWVYREASLAPPDGVRPLWRTLGRINQLAAAAPAAVTWEEIRKKVRVLLDRTGSKEA